MDYMIAFVVGGFICVLVQILMEKTKLMPGRIMVLLVVSGVVLSFLGIFDPLKEFAGAGVTVPLLGFGHVLMQGVEKSIDEFGFMGLFMGGFQAAAVGTSAALIFGFLVAMCTKPKMKH
ncbi:MAG: SpoVA/SpoVAEb family sporulation membrane protein [Lachnospiraceae bacterium]